MPSKKPSRPDKSKKSVATPWAKIALSVLTLVVLGGIFLDAKVRYGLNERQWQLPARVYARALSLEPGKAISSADLRLELSLLGYQFSPSARRPGSAYQRGNTFQIASRGFEAVAQKHQALRFYVEIVDNRVARLQTLSGDRLPSVTLEPLEIGSIYPSHREDRLLVTLQQVPRSLAEILVLVEDKQFYQHWGVSPRAIARALMANIDAGKTVQGGSTITQQLVKNVFLNQDQNLLRKGVEAIMALLVELHFSKQQILESYINEVYLGQEGPKEIHGFALASRHYFNRPLADLTPAQIALLVGLVKGPSYYDPWRHPQRAIDRRNTVLGLMLAHQLISPEQEQSYRQSGLELAKTHALAGAYPAYLDLVRRQLRRDYSEQSLHTDGMRIFTAFDPLAQHHAERSVEQVLVGKPKPVEVAMVVTDVKTGDIVAVVGGRQMRFAGFNRALDAVRPIGSLIKPAVYLAALRDPEHYTLSSTISDGPVEVAGADGSVWQPRNFDRRDHGAVLLHSALARSYNQATARLGMEVGLGEVLEVVAGLGITRKLPELPSMLLGAGAMAPIEVASMYQTIAAAGVHSPLRAIVDISDKDGVPLARYPVRQSTAIEKPLMHLLHYAMVEVVEEGTGSAVYQRLPRDYRVAGKTGTTNDLRDSWFAGFAGDYLAVVWMGRDDNKSAQLTGSSGSLIVWREFIARASKEPLAYSVPPGIAYHWIDSSTGLLSREVCENSRYLPFLQGSAPTDRTPCRGSLPGVLRWFKNLF